MNLLGLRKVQLTYTISHIKIEIQFRLVLFHNDLILAELNCMCLSISLIACVYL